MQTNQSSQSNIMNFNFEGNEVRTVTDEHGDPWFVAKDVAQLLGYTNTADAIAKHCRAVVQDGIKIRDSIGRMQKTALIPERDVYRLIMRSKLPSSEKFEEWVVSEVLPSIRKRGMFSLSDVSNLIDEARLKSENVVYVYVVENEVTGSVKIGVSSSPKKRLSSLQTGTEHKLNLAHVSDATDVVSEKKVHDLLNESCIRGEWFNVSTDDAISAVSCIVNGAANTDS